MAREFMPLGSHKMLREVFASRVEQEENKFLGF
jgi:hypothetical protein